MEKIYKTTATKDSIKRELIEWFRNNKAASETRSNYYCGITKDPDDRKTQHESKDHDGKEIKKMIAVKCKDLQTSGDVEEKMGEEKFDIGNPSHLANGAEEDSVWVYLYKKP